MVLETKIESQKVLSSEFEDELSIDLEPRPPSLVESIAQWYYESFGQSELILAKENFCLQFGKPFPEDESFEERMSYFLDHFVFFRVLDNPAKTPFELFKEAHNSYKSNELPSVKIEDLSFHHSIFKVIKAKEHNWKVRDYFGRKEYLVSRPKYYWSLGKGDVVQGTLMLAPNESLFSQGLITHTSDLDSYLRKRYKKIRKKADFDYKFSELANLSRCHLLQFRIRNRGALAQYQRFFDSALEPTLQA